MTNLLKKIKEFSKLHKKSAATVVVFLIALIVYCISGQDMDIIAITEKLCSIVGC